MPRAKRLPNEAVYARAQLASVLRDIGLVEEAKQEGAAALATLETMPQPRMAYYASRPMFRERQPMKARATTQPRLNGYAQFVQFGSQSARCGGCHSLDGPRDMSFFATWWAGRKFAEYAARTGQVDTLIAAHEHARDVSTRRWRPARAGLSARAGQHRSRRSAVELVDPVSQPRLEK